MKWLELFLFQHLFLSFYTLWNSKLAIVIHSWVLTVKPYNGKTFFHIMILTDVTLVYLVLHPFYSYHLLHKYVLVPCSYFKKDCLLELIDKLKKKTLIFVTLEFSLRGKQGTISSNCTFFMADRVIFMKNDFTNFFADLTK